MSTYNEGDLIEAVKDETVIRGRLSKIPGWTSLQIPGAGWGVDSLLRDGFILRLVGDDAVASELRTANKLAYLALYKDRPGGFRLRNEIEEELGVSS